MFTLNVVHVFCLAQIFTTANCNSPADIYYLDDSRGLSRRFDGIGGLSGGGVNNTVFDVLLHLLSCSDTKISRG